MYNKVEIGEALSVDTVSAYLKKKFPKASAARIFGEDSEYDDKRKVWLMDSMFLLWMYLSNVNHKIKYFIVSKYQINLITFL